MARILYLFPDTNVFLQCKPLDQVDWQAYAEWERVELVVTRPVQAEVDSLKGRGNRRQSSKARAVSSLLRKLLDESTEFLVLKNSPEVRLTVCLALKPDAAAADSLDYLRPDDQLVGTALAFQKANPEAQVSVLTDDTGVMFSAQNVGVLHTVLSPDWMLPPETDDAEKRERALKEQIAQYQRAEPKFELSLQTVQAPEHEVTPQGSPKHRPPTFGPAPARLNAEVAVYLSLSEGEVEELMTRLKERFPKAEDFGPIESQVRTPRSTSNLLDVFNLGKEVFTPSTKREISEYKDAYDSWIHECRQRFQKLHAALNAALDWPLVCATITNIGSRPAEDALVVVKAHGKLGVLAPSKNAPHEDDEESAEQLTRLSRPPRVPKGAWTVQALSAVVVPYRDIPGLAEAKRFMHAIDTPSLYQRLERDDNAFYWRGGHKAFPTTELALNCKQWRHSQAPEDFLQYVMCAHTAGEHAGVVKVEVHAANLTAPVRAQLPVCIVVRHVSCLDLARTMVEGL